MIEQINILRGKLLDNLLTELKLTNSGFVEKLEQGKPENFYNYKEAEKELDKPVEPWTELLSSLLDFELGFDFLKLTIEQMPKATNGRELHFNFGTYSIYMHASLERLEHFIKKLKRKGITTETDQILAFLKEAITDPNLKEARHIETHGRFIGTSIPLAKVKTEYYWEPSAVIRIIENHIEEWHSSYELNIENRIDFKNSEFDRLSISITNVFRMLNHNIN